MWRCTKCNHLSFGNSSNHEAIVASDRILSPTSLSRRDSIHTSCVLAPFILINLIKIFTVGDILNMNELHFIIYIDNALLKVMVLNAQLVNKIQIKFLRLAITILICGAWFMNVLAIFNTETSCPFFLLY